MATEPILCRIDRLDHMLKQLEEIRGVSRSSTAKSSSGASTPSSGMLTSGDVVPTSSSLDTSPRSMEKHCRPISRVVMETEVKGTLVDRLDLFESRIMKLCLRMEAELAAEKKREGGGTNCDNESAHKKGGALKRMFNKLLIGRRRQT